MLLEIARGRRHTNGGNYYMLLDKEKISPNGGWCVGEFEALFGTAFQLEIGTGVRVNVTKFQDAVEWLRKGKITKRDSLLAKENPNYPVFARSNFNDIIVLFFNNDAGIVVWKEPYPYNLAKEEVGYHNSHWGGDGLQSDTWTILTLEEYARLTGRNVNNHWRRK